MTESGDADDVLEEAGNLGLDLVIVLGVSEGKGSVILHNVESDLEASFLLKTFVGTLEMSILEDLYGRTRNNLN